MYAKIFYSMIVFVAPQWIKFIFKDLTLTNIFFYNFL